MKTLLITAEMMLAGKDINFGSFAWHGVVEQYAPERFNFRLWRYDIKTDIVVKNIKVGDWLWFNCCGKGTTAGKCNIPSDPRLAYLWEQGFRKSTRLTKSDLEEYRDHTVYNYVYEELGGDFTPSYYENGYTEGSWAMVGLRHYKVVRNNEIMFEGIIGRINGTDNGIVRWYMDKKCMLKEIKQAFGDVDIVPPNCIAVPMTCC